MSNERNSDRLRSLGATMPNTNQFPITRRIEPGDIALYCSIRSTCVPKSSGRSAADSPSKTPTPHPTSTTSLKAISPSPPAPPRIDATDPSTTTTKTFFSNRRCLKNALTSAPPGDYICTEYILTWFSSICVLPVHAPRCRYCLYEVWW